MFGLIRAFEPSFVEDNLMTKREGWSSGFGRWVGGGWEVGWKGIRWVPESFSICQSTQVPVALVSVRGMHTEQRPECVCVCACALARFPRGLSPAGVDRESSS